MFDAVARLSAALEGRYTIERELGEGGMATVYLADDLKHERKVALKVLKPELAAVVGAERFLVEIKTTANLTHPHILPLFDSGEADGFLFYVMPHIDGESLRDRIDREKQLSVDDAVAITRKVADALDYAHEHGVVHRDIKPGNILLSERGEPLIADFGIALALAQAGGGSAFIATLNPSNHRDGTKPRHAALHEPRTGHGRQGRRPPFGCLRTGAVCCTRCLLGSRPSRQLRPKRCWSRFSRWMHRRSRVSEGLCHLTSAMHSRRPWRSCPADRFTSAAEFATALRDESSRIGLGPRLPRRLSRSFRAKRPVPGIG